MYLSNKPEEFDKFVKKFVKDKDLLDTVDLEIFKARTVEGTYIPFSIALMLFLETSALSDNSC